MTATGIPCPYCSSLNLVEGIRTQGVVEVQTTGNHMRQTLLAWYSLHTFSKPRFAIIRCGGCDQIYFGNGGTYPKTLWPLTVPPTPDACPPKVAEAYRDCRLALEAGSKIGALMAGRTVLIRALRDKKVAQLSELVPKGELTKAHYGGADQLRLWAAIAGHDDIEVDTFSETEVRDVLEYLRTVLEALYTHQAKVNELVAKTKKAKGG